MTRFLRKLDPFDVALRLTLLGLLLRPVGGKWLHPALLALACAGLLVPAWLRRPELWLAIVGLTGLRVLLDWPLADNHAYLLAYWCLAIVLSRLVDDGPGVLAWNGRWLVGLVFAFAVLWKIVLSPDYLDGTFFHVTLLTDPRFADLTRLLGGLTPEGLDAQRVFLERHVDGAMRAAAAAPELPSRFTALVCVLTVWTVALEAGVALAFLWPLGRGVSRVRNGLLLLFCATTYAIATVEGFGWLLVVMGLAQCERERETTRLLYLAAFALILFYREVPWAALLLEWRAVGA